MNKFLFLTLSSLTMLSAASNKDELQYETMRPAVIAAHNLRINGITHDNGNFAVIKDGKSHKVKPWMIDKTLRGRSNEQMTRYLAHHAILVKQSEGEEFFLRAHNRQLGGGLGGATVGAFIGKWGVTIIGQGLITGVSTTSNFLIPGSGIWIDTVVRPALTPYIEAASIKAAVGCGILGGTLTGPV